MLQPDFFFLGSIPVRDYTSRYSGWT